MRVLLVRHGATTWNEQARYQGHQDVPLSTRGRIEAGCLAERLAGEIINTIYSSDLTRARETSEMIAARLGVTTKLEPRLREIRMGEWQGLTYEEVHRRYFGKTDPLPCYAIDQLPAGGETLGQVQTRVIEAMRDIIAQHKDADTSVLIVTHGACLRAMVCGWLGIELNAYWKLAFDSGSISEVFLSPHGAVLSRLNDTSHLRARGS
jgi:broad specificity phosphatase PhoE